MVDMTDLKSVEHKSLVWVRLPPLVRCNDSETNGGTDAKHEMETFETHIKEWMRYKPHSRYIIFGELAELV
jgi:hypothetical protein